MTEREYVETIRKTAEAYLKQIRNPTSVTPVRHWERTKQNLSPHTAIALCDAWLTMQEAEDSLADFNANGGISLDELKKELEE